MDISRFNAVARSLPSARSRRATLGGLLTGTLGLLAFSGIQEATAETGKCKPKCGECETCKKGDCDKKNGKKRCKRGRCRAKTTGTACAGGSCQSGRCQIVDAAPSCAPSTCPPGANCGTIANVCGGTVPCGPSCEDPKPVCDRNICRTCAADRECCGPANSGLWCDGGECVNGGSSLTNCQGFCGGSVSNCGQTRICPDCATCAGFCTGGTGMTCIGPHGPGQYCVNAGTLESCDKSSTCQTPGTICCGTTCMVACT